jgi:hypothetical protein
MEELIYCKDPNCLETTDNIYNTIKFRYDSDDNPIGYFCDLCHENNSKEQSEEYPTLSPQKKFF